jgi:hypothetical protein
MKFSAKVTKNLIPQKKSAVSNATKKALRTVAQDLSRTSSDATPFKTGDLAGSYSIAYQFGGSKLTATVEYSVMNAGFNYAVAMHEWAYKLGEGSQGRSGTGMSGRSYPAGRKFLFRVLMGESKAYRDYIGEQINAVLK